MIDFTKKQQVEFKIRSDEDNRLIRLWGFDDKRMRRRYDPCAGRGRFCQFGFKNQGVNAAIAQQTLPAFLTL